MSTSLLYHGFGIRDHKYVKTEYKERRIYFHIEHKREKLTCPDCGSDNLVFRGCKQREFKSLPIGRKEVILVLNIQRVECISCRALKQVNVHFAEGKRRYTKTFEKYALELSKKMTIKDVAAHLKVSWDVIKDIQKRYLNKTFSKPRLKDLCFIAIDEIAIGKNHKYFTVVLDLETGAIVFVGEGKSQAALEPFWKRLRRAKPTIYAVAIDLSPAYRGAVMKNLPGTTIVYDHFHVIKAFNDDLSDFRRKLFNKLESKSDKKILKGTRWILLKGSENIKDDEKQRLKSAIKLNKPLATVYYMKEELRQLWSIRSFREAQKYLLSWIERAWDSGISMLKKFAKKMIKHFHGVVAYIRCPISTGPLEATNNNIKNLQRQAYGFRDKEFFKLKILALHTMKYAFVG